MKHEKLSLKWKIFVYLIGLCGILLVVLWLSQTVYLDKFYKYVKESDLKESVNLLAQAAEEENSVEAIKQIAQENELSVTFANAQGEQLYSERFAQMSAIDSLTKEQLAMYYKEVKENGGRIEYNSNEELRKSELEGEIKKDKIENFEKWDQEMQGEWNKKEDWQRQLQPEASNAAADAVPLLPFDGMERPIEEHLVRYLRGGQESMVCAQMVTIQDEEILLLVTVKLTPVNATVQTLRVQLVYISVIIIVLALILSFLISRSVSKSIIRVNESAKELAKGNFDVTFDGKDYKEIGQLSDTLNYAAGELAKTENFQRELLANVSHDLRTPLTMIIAYSEGMRDLPGENTPENIQVVIEEAQRLTNLVNDMLDISKLQAGVLELDKHKYDLTDSINGVMERYVKLKEQEQYQIQFIYDVHVMVYADEFKIFQVLYNLINNAINYTGEDKKVIVQQKVIKDKVRIEVCDTGAGIPKEELGNVWERYYKVDKVHKRAVQGTGLGLSICKNILQMHGAEYGVESRAGKGSTFWFELKVCKDA